MNGNPHPDWGFWAAQHAAQVVANAAAIQQAQANASALAIAQAQTVGAGMQARAALVAAVKSHIDAAIANPAVATNADAVSHLAAAEQILATVT